MGADDGGGVGWWVQSNRCSRCWCPLWGPGTRDGRGPELWVVIEQHLTCLWGNAWTSAACLAQCFLSVLSHNRQTYRQHCPDISTALPCARRRLGELILALYVEGVQACTPRRAHCVGQHAPPGREHCVGGAQFHSSTIRLAHGFSPRLLEPDLFLFLFFFSFILCLDGRAGPMMYPLWAQAGCVCHSRSTRCNVQLDLLHHPHCLFLPAF